MYLVDMTVLQNHLVKNGLIQSCHIKVSLHVHVRGSESHTHINEPHDPPLLLHLSFVPSFSASQPKFYTHAADDLIPRLFVLYAAHSFQQLLKTV